MVDLVEVNGMNLVEVGSVSAFAFAVVFGVVISRVLNSEDLGLNVVEGGLDEVGSVSTFALAVVFGVLISRVLDSEDLDFIVVEDGLDDLTVVDLVEP